MYPNNNYSTQINLHQQLEQEIHTLNNQFLDWKRIVSQLSPASQFPHTSGHLNHPILPEINFKVDRIYNLVSDFCRKFDRQLLIIKQKQISLSNANNRKCFGPTDIRVSCDEEKIRAVNDKISLLEENLRRTQQNQKKLVDTLNIMIKKYQSDDRSRSINDDYYFNSSGISQKQKEKSRTTLFPLNLCGKFKRDDEARQQQASKIRAAKKPNPNSKFILVDQSYTLGYSTQSQAVSTPGNQMRFFSHVDSKLSLKQPPKHSGALYRIDEQRGQSRFVNSDVGNTSRHVSLDRHGHRWKFMMENLDH